MIDYDADEIVPQRKRSERTPLIDKALGATGIALAALATFFPWYAFLHQDQFSMPVALAGQHPRCAGPRRLRRRLLAARHDGPRCSHPGGD